MGENGLSASDIALMTNRNDAWSESSFFWIFALLILAGGGFNGGFFGNGGLGNATAAGQMATQNDVQRGFDNLGLQDQSRDILAAVHDGTVEAVSATNQAKYDNINVAKDIQAAITAQISEVKTAQAQSLANQNQCCSNTLRAIDNVNYQSAQNVANLTASLTEQIQGVKDLINGNRMADMQSQINDLQLQNAMSGVVRYPMAWTYNAGMSPFCGCGCNCGMM